MHGKITKKLVDAIDASKGDLVVWDTELTGFGLRCRAKGSKHYVLKARVAGRQRWVTIGRHGALTPDQARTEARRLLGSIAGGPDPAGLRDTAKAAATVDELA